jgi:hypothetical protein
MTRDELTPGREVWVCDLAESILPQRGTVRAVNDRAQVMTAAGVIGVEPKYCYPSKAALAAAWAGLCRSMADYYCGLAGLYRRAGEMMGEPREDPEAVSIGALPGLDGAGRTGAVR